MEFVRSRPSLDRTPAGILKAIDEFARTQKYLMNIGEDKGKIVTEIIRDRKPEIMLELGGYCGYSTILFADAVRESGGKKYFSLERSPKFAKVIEALLELAGLKDFAEVVVGSSDEGIRKLNKSGQVTRIDMLFLDHYKPAYTTDLKLCETLGLIVKGTVRVQLLSKTSANTAQVLAADNVIKPGNPPYLKYVRSSVKEKVAALNEVVANTDTDHFSGRSAAQYGQVETLASDVFGNPKIIYESRLVESFEPSGVPVCLLLLFNNPHPKN